MKKNIFGTILIGLIVLFLIVYAGYQAYRYFYSPYTTETVYSYTVADSVKTQGVVIRDETVIDQTRNSSSISYQYDDGTKVRAGMPLATLYNSEQEIRDAQELEEVNQEIAALTSLQNRNTDYFIYSDSINRQLNEQLGKLVKIYSSGAVAGMDETTNQILNLLNKKQLSTGKIENFEDRIAILNDRKEQLSAKIGGEYPTISSPSQGYFIRSVDGFEDVISPKNMADFSVSDYVDLLNRQPVINQDAVGKIMNDHHWYYAALMTKEDAAKFRNGLAVTISFGVYGMDAIDATVYTKIGEEEEANRIVIFQCTYISPELMNIRNNPAEIKFKSYTGLKVNSKAIRYLDNQMGVYIDDGYQISFRPISVIREEVGYVLCSSYMEDQTTIEQFDQVIVEGTELYDGKPIR